MARQGGRGQRVGLARRRGRPRGVWGRACPVGEVGQGPGAAGRWERGGGKVVTSDGTAVAVDVPVVAGVDAAVFTIPTDAPEADGTLTWDATTMVLVTVRAGNERGIGWTYGAAAARCVVTDQLAPAVLGRSALDVAGAAEAMARAVRNIGRPGVAATALSAVDTALWDVKARLLGCPLAGLLGRWRDAVPVYGSGGFTSYDERQLGDQLAGWVERDGIPRVKIKIGEDWGGNERRDLERVALARQVIGPDAELYVDANGAYRTGQAVRVAARLGGHGVTWFEEPVSSEDLAGLAAVRAQVQPDVAAGEYSWSLADSPAPSTACSSTSPDVAGSPASSPRRRSRPGTTWTSRHTVRRTCTLMSVWRCRTCGTSSTSMIISGSSGCSSTVP